MSGATVKYVGLKPKKQSSSESLSSDDWVIDPAELEAAFSSKTKVLLINNPQNPTGKVI
jgi:aspartate/methionine/tyrosine aminotransferase